VLRAQSGTIDDIDDDPTGAKAVWQRGLLGGAPQKVVYLTGLLRYLPCVLEPTHMGGGGGEGLMMSFVEQMSQHV
jgi:hypothetical protein